MCGIAVTVSFDGRPADPLVLGRMADALQHRGPDDSGVATYGAVGFGFRRLAILDLSPAGHQPMASADGRHAIVFNGEIYNYVELKEELRALGHTFQTSTDTEVLLAAYRQWGESCVERFNGMWAFAIFDAREQRVFASRDRFGVKPLYVLRLPNMIVLASEIKAIVASGFYVPAPNWKTASRFLVRSRLDDDDETFYEGVEQVRPGTSLRIERDGRTHEARFWSLPGPAQPSSGDPASDVRELLRDAVRLRMRSDVPVGVCLSGGIDSNAIISFMAGMWPSGAAARLQAFSYIPKEFSEARYIHETLQKTGAELNELTVTPQQLWDVLPEALWYYDGPVHSPTALIGFELMRLARSRGVKVVLNGQGADEVNAGYPQYFQYYWSDLMRAGRLTAAASEIGRYSRAHGVSAAQLFAGVAATSVKTALEAIPGYLRFSRRRRETRLRRDSWFTGDFLARLDVDDVADPSMTFEDALRYGVERRPLPVYLRVEDRNSMAHSVEARLPFLDYRLVSYAFSLAPEWKLRGQWNKFVVREAASGVIAEPVRTRVDKMGFPTPSRAWFKGPWAAPVRDLLASRRVREEGVIDVAAVQRDLDRTEDGTPDVTGKLFRIAEFSIWSAHRAGSADIQPSIRHEVAR